MKQIHTLYAFLLFTLVGCLVACEKDIDFKGSISAPKMVLNSLLTPDSVASVQLSQSRFVLGEETPYKRISNAEVSMFVNGTFKEKLLHTGDGNYKGIYYPKSSDDIKIEVTKGGYDYVFAETIIPNIPNVAVTDSILTINKVIEDYPYEPNSVIETTSYDLKFNLTLTDAANEENYYYIKGKRYYRNQVTGQVIEDPLDIELSEVLKKNKFDNEDFFQDIFGDDDIGDIDNLFHDRFIDGKDIVFDFSFQGLIDSHVVTNGEEWDDSRRNKFTIGYMIEIGEISKDYYDYMVSAQRALNAEEGGFLTEPVKIHSNINNGIGILGSYNTYRFTSELESYSPFY